MVAGLQYSVMSVQEGRSVSTGRNPNISLDHMVSSSTTVGLETIAMCRKGGSAYAKNDLDILIPTNFACDEGDFKPPGWADLDG